MLPAEHVASTTAPHLVGRLAEAVRKNPDAVALRYKSRGAWLVWTWRDVVRETDRFASFLRAEGIGVGSAVALAGEIRPSILFSALAAEAIGAAVVSVAPGTTPPQLEAVFDRNSIGLALMHGCRDLAAWLQALETRPQRVAIVFDHATAAGKAPEDGVIPISAVMEASPAHDWARCAPRRHTVFATPRSPLGGSVHGVARGAGRDHRCMAQHRRRTGGPGAVGGGGA